MTVEALGPPPQLRSIAAGVEELLRGLFVAERTRWAEVDERLVEAIDELADHVLRGGKRLRAAFCYWGAVGAGGEEPAGVWEAAAAFELLQGFALIHDDVMDDADTRRGHPTVHVRHAERLRDAGWRGEPRRYGEGVAILVGDLGHVYADRLTRELTPAARAVWDELRVELNLGQYLDLRSAAAGELDRTTAERVSLFKSGLYTIVRPLQVGAVLVPEPDPTTIERLDAYGRPLGRAFQLRDDLLGVALERADDRQRRLLAAVGRSDLDDGAVHALVEVLHDTGAIADIERRIGELVEQSIAVVAELAFEPEARTALTVLAEFVGGRDR
jgi:geranylgeranyl diphosphate synthase, type I